MIISKLRKAMLTIFVPICSEVNCSCVPNKNLCYFWFCENWLVSALHRLVALPHLLLL